MIYEIKSNSYRAAIDSNGAQLTSFKCLSCGKEMLWSADPEVWGKVSPVLFPVIGPLKGSGYTHNGNNYTLPRHGFASRQLWQGEKISVDSVKFTLKANSETLAVYPFVFTATLLYTLKGSTLRVKFEVTNAGESDMFYEYGAHPAFATERLAADGKIADKSGTLSDSSFTFSKPFNCKTLRLGKDSGLVNETKHEVFEGDSLQLNPSLFDNDAMILTDLPSGEVILNRPSYPKIKVSFDGLSVLGVWAANGTNRYVCIEPWTCVPEREGAPEEISKKPNMTRLKPSATDSYTYSIEVL